MNTGWTPYAGTDYLHWDAVESWCRATAAAHPDWVRLDVVGDSLQGRPLLLLTLTAPGDDRKRPGFWLDGGTHAAEWTGVMAALYSVSKWVERIDTDPDFRGWLADHAIYVMPCISPDGFDAMRRGQPFLRSSLHPPPDGTVRTGLDAQDLNGDGTVRWMRWKHPAGPYVADADVPMFMRPRTLDDDPDDAYFFCQEGLFLNWDGHQWSVASLPHGLDLNRNFPGHWGPFSMFGMNGGAYSLSASESRAVVDTFTARPCIGAGLTNHTYTGCILTQPYRENSPLGTGDVLLLERLAEMAVTDTGYRVFRVIPDFTYDPKNPVVGVWSDTMSATFGVPGYTLELWDPFGFAGIENEKPAEFFTRPDPVKIKQMIGAFSKLPDAVNPWAPFDHPQLGPVELGGLDYTRTVRNPPPSLLEAECVRGYQVADRLRRCLPRVTAQTIVQSTGELTCLEVILENLGFLASSGLTHGVKLPGTPPVSARVELGDGLELVQGAPEVGLRHLDGWGSRGGAGIHSVYPGLSEAGHRDVARWWIRGSGTAHIHWCGGRGGRGKTSVVI